MSMKTVIRIHCDKCGSSMTLTDGSKARAIRASAKNDGWKLGKQRDLCKLCSEELAEAVKTLLAAG